MSTQQATLSWTLPLRLWGTTAIALMVAGAGLVGLGLAGRYYGTIPGAGYPVVAALVVQYGLLLYYTLDVVTRTDRPVQQWSRQAWKLTACLVVFGLLGVVFNGLFGLLYCGFGLVSGLVALLASYGELQSEVS